MRFVFQHFSESCAPFLNFTFVPGRCSGRYTRLLFYCHSRYGI